MCWWEEGAMLQPTGVVMVWAGMEVGAMVTPFLIMTLTGLQGEEEAGQLFSSPVVSMQLPLEVAVVAVEEIPMGVLQAEAAGEARLGAGLAQQDVEGVADLKSVVGKEVPVVG